MTGRNIIITALLLLLFCVAGRAAYAIDLTQSIAAKNRGEPATASRWMVAAANPHAVRAGAEVLARGGTAADAMVAVQSVLGLVEPQSSGLGGGAFLVWYDAVTGSVTTLDGRETAPAAVDGDLFIGDDGMPMQFLDAVVGGISVATPATPALMRAAHDRWGRLEWRGLFGHAIALAENGFAVSPRLAALVARDAERLTLIPATRDYFLPDGNPIAAGDILKNPAYAETLRSLSEDGGVNFYLGDIASDIVRTVQNAPRNPGRLAREDLAAYEVIERRAVCIPYRGYDVCGMGPPSSGGLTVAQILGMVEGYDLAALGPRSAEAWRIIGDASRLAFADRARYMADSDFVSVPAKGLLIRDYLAARAKLLGGPNAPALENVAAGMPRFDDDNAAMQRGDDASMELASTSHISIVDQYGNALSMTTTIENVFGSRLMTQGGFLLNNEMTDFSFRATDKDGKPVANRIEPGKRPRSSMAPTIILRDGKPVLVIGSPGGSRIIGYVARAVIAHIDWGMDVQAAIAAPHLVNRFGTYDLEAGGEAESLAAPLEALGYKVNKRALNSGLHAIAIAPDGTLTGGADPRREGLAFGK